MKNPVKSLKSSWNRARVNHEKKTQAGLWSAPPAAIAAAVVIAPLDMGTTAGLLIGTAGLGSILPITCWLTGLESSHKNYFKEIVELNHCGEAYYVTKQQKWAYDNIESEKSKLKEQYKKMSTTDKQRQKIENKAKKLLQQQDDIMASKNIVKVADAQKAPELDFEKLRAGKTLGRN